MVNKMSIGDANVVHRIMEVRELLTEVDYTLEGLRLHYSANLVAAISYIRDSKEELDNLIGKLNSPWSSD